MQATARSPRDVATETDVAVLQVEVAHLREDMREIKTSINNLHNSIDSSSENTLKLLREMKTSTEVANTELNKKISALEKWRYMLMGAGVVLGYYGFELAAKLFQAH